MRKLLLFFLMLSLIGFTYGQELRCSFQVNHQQIQTTNIQLFQSLQTDINEFMNNHKWTEHVYSDNERIECNFILNLTEYNGSDRYKGTLQVQSRRPVYNTNFNSILFNYKEEDNEFQFQYIEHQPLEFNPATHLSNLTSMLAFYSYLIIGLDYDSFSQEGGSEYFLKAQTIVNNAQNSIDIGWKAYESRKQNNRYFLIDNILNKSQGPIRRCLYRYHRLGLDVMSEKPEIGRAEIAESLKLLQKAFREKPNSLILQIFFNAKSDELVKIFSDGPRDERQKAVEILKEIDLTNATKYDKILQQ
jgi:hypothetical protein